MRNIFALLLLGTSILFVTALGPACSRTPSSNSKKPNATPTAKKLHSIAQANDTASAATYQTGVSGEIVALAENLISLKTETSPDGIDIATAPDVNVWEQGQLVGQETLEPGLLVDVFREQRGNRMDGYQVLAVRVNISGRTSETKDRKDFARTVKGTVVEVKANAITIRYTDLPDTEPKHIPLVPNVLVNKDGRVGGRELLSPGDEVSLAVAAHGSRMDGYMDMATEIHVTSPTSQ